jgi:hypothetical protein
MKSAMKNRQTTKRVNTLTAPVMTPTINRAGGKSFLITDPAEKLLTMTGGSFFNEPKYYDAVQCKGKRGAGGKILALAKRLELVGNEIDGFADCDELNSTAKEIIAAIVSISNSKRPDDALMIAAWLRQSMNIRLTPQVILTVCSQLDGTKPFVRAYAPHIILRPDEVKDNLMLHRFLFGKKCISNCLGLGLGDSIKRFGERGLLRYEGNEYPRWKDVLCWLPRRSTNGGWPLPAPVAKYFITGNIVDPEATPIIAAREALGKCTTFNAEARRLAVKSQVNWEVLLSQFGSDKNKVWSFLLDNNLVYYMALLRNLRNILQAGVNDELLDLVARKLADPTEVRKSKQLPFRFLAAFEALNDVSLRPVQQRQMVEAVESACDAAAENIPVLPGLTVVFADNSGSMSTPVSDKSKISCRDAANMLAGIVGKRGEKAVVCAFADTAKIINHSRNNTVLNTAKQFLDPANNCGGGTSASECVALMIKHNLKPDRVILLSDMQSWADGMSSWGSRGDFKTAWQQFKKHIGKKCWLHTVHLNGYGDSLVDKGCADVHLMSGFSEKIMEQMLRAEGVMEEFQAPVLEQIRTDFNITMLEAKVEARQNLRRLAEPVKYSQD